MHHWRASWKQRKCTARPLVLMPDSGRAEWNSDVLNILTYSCICYINNAPAALPNTRGAFFACLAGLVWVSVVAATPVCPNQRKWNSDVPGEYNGWYTPLTLPPGPATTLERCRLGPTSAGRCKCHNPPPAPPKHHARGQGARGAQRGPHIPPCLVLYVWGVPQVPLCWPRHPNWGYPLYI